MLQVKYMYRYKIHIINKLLINTTAYFFPNYMYK